MNSNSESWFRSRLADLEFRNGNLKSAGFEIGCNIYITLFILSDLHLQKEFTIFIHYEEIRSTSGQWFWNVWDTCAIHQISKSPDNPQRQIFYPILHNQCRDRGTTSWGHEYIRNCGFLCEPCVQKRRMFQVYFFGLTQYLYKCEIASFFIILLFIYFSFNQWFYSNYSLKLILFDELIFMIIFEWIFSSYVPSIHLTINFIYNKKIQKKTYFYGN